MPALPIDSVLPELRQALMAHQQVLLEAPPGAGKTTRVPLALLDEPWLTGQTILLLEPRRLAARAAAERLAAELGEKLGERVGYRIRLESKVSHKTRIEVVTEGILTRRLQDDPGLEGVGLVIFDEFHERSLDADLALALTLNGRELLRDTPLKLLVMSATLESERLAQLLGNAPIIRSEGRLFPVQIRWGRTWQSGEACEPWVVQSVLQALAEETGSLLVFLPGQAEIRRVAVQLADALAGHEHIHLCPLHGELELAAQRAAIAPAPAGSRKVVLATNIAETSLTIEGVRVVIDAGLARVPRFDPGTAMTRLETQRISRASAAQRAGRAGRLEPGVCYRRWSEAQHQQLPAYAAAEILQADLANLALQLVRWGAQPEELCWLDPPPSAAYAQARELLENLGALQPQGQLSAHGQAMAELPAHPRLAHLLLRGQELGQADLASQLAALLSERDLLRGGQGADLQLRVDLLNAEKPSKALQGPLQRVRQLARQFRACLPTHKIAESAQTTEHWLGVLLALAYPDRIAQQRRPGSPDYRLANGRAAHFAETDSLMKEPWLAIAELGSRQGQREERIYLAAALDSRCFDKLLADRVSEQEVLDWDEREGLLRAERQRRVGDLLLSSESLPQADGAARSRALLGVVRRKGLELLPWTAELRQWQARIALLRRLELERLGESQWPDFSDTLLLESLEDWLLPYLDKVSRLSHFAGLNLAEILQARLPWPLPQRLEELAPRSLQVPSGSNIRLDYSEFPPVLAVRLQELFGLADTPRIAQGQVAVKLHLLSPAQRPVQVTQDLRSFWCSTYAEVKKDLKGRYPKHYWPDDPLIAEATARAKPRR